MSNIKGDLGEERVSFLLSKLDKNDYNVISNIKLLDEEFLTFNIDHMVISKYGLFIIETKNLKGVIEGNQFHDNWSQIIEGQKYKFYNPIRQNSGHIVRLKQLLSNGLKIVSIICFTERAELKLSLKNATVVNTMGLLDAITVHKDIVFSQEQLDYLIYKIEKEMKRYEKSGIKHEGLMEYKNTLKNPIKNQDDELLTYIDKTIPKERSYIKRENKYIKSLLEFVDNQFRRKNTRGDEYGKREQSKKEK